MEQQKKSTALEKSQSREDNNKSTLIKYEAVENTPFTLVERENEVLITIGNQVCDANVFANRTEAKKYINKKPWMLIATTSLILSQNVNKGGKEWVSQEQSEDKG